MKDTATAFWITAPRQSELRTASLGPLAPDYVRVQSLFTGVSRGTERLVYEGRVPESERLRMRAPFQEGEFPGPLKYGYSNVGKVIAGPKERIGQLVFSLYPHQDRFDVPADAAHPLPAKLPARRAVLAANMETALNAFWDASPLPGDQLSVVGAGAVGCLLASLLVRSLALRVEVIDVNPKRRSVVEGLGAQFCTPETATPGSDLVFHTSATAAGLEHSLSLCRTEGRVIELSWYGDTPLTLTLGSSFHAGRLSLKSSQVGTVSPQKPGWDYRKRLGLALSLLDDPRLDTLLSPPVPLAELPSVFASMTRPATAPPLHRSLLEFPTLSVSMSPGEE